MTDEPWFNQQQQQQEPKVSKTTYPTSTKNCPRGTHIEHRPGTVTREQVRGYLERHRNAKLDDALEALGTKTVSVMGSTTVRPATLPYDVIVQGRVLSRAKKAAHKRQRAARRQNRGNTSARR